MTHERRRSALALLGAALLVAGLAACAPKEEAAEPAEEPAAAPAEPAAEEHADHPAPGPGARIFFVEPANGATVTSPVKIVFGAENFIIEKRVEGVINPGAGHHHIGLDTQCLPPGEIIPTAAPWVHFGDGSVDDRVPAAARRAPPGGAGRRRRAPHARRAGSLRRAPRHRGGRSGGAQGRRGDSVAAFRRGPGQDDDAASMTEP